MEITKSHVENILNEVLSQLENGKIEIGDWTFHTKLLNENSKTNNGELSIKINNKKVLIENLMQYFKIANDFYQKDKSYYDLTEENFLKKLLLDLIVNSTNFDLNNFEKHIKQRTEMLKEDLTCEQSVQGVYQDADIMIEICKNFSNLEGPYKFNIQFDNNFHSFKLPSVTFGKIDDEVFVYCLQGEKEKQTNLLAKRLDRHFRKANKGVDMNDEILSNVSVSALVSLTIFLTHMKQLGVKKVAAYNFMPIRYNTTLSTKMLRLKEQEAQQEFEEVHNRNQFNITNKFFNTLIRYAHHFGVGCEYDDIADKMELDLNDKEIHFDNILFDIEDSMLNYLKNDKTI